MPSHVLMNWSHELRFYLMCHTALKAIKIKLYSTCCWRNSSSSHRLLSFRVIGYKVKYLILNHGTLNYHYQVSFRLCYLDSKDYEFDNFHQMSHKSHWNGCPSLNDHTSGTGKLAPHNSPIPTPLNKICWNSTKEENCRKKVVIKYFYHCLKKKASSIPLKNFFSYLESISRKRGRNIMTIRYQQPTLTTI